jgi:hypothetical protein
MNHATIAELPMNIDRLQPSEKARFDRIFRAWSITASCDCPPEMTQWAERHFGSVDRIKSQTVIRVQNLRTSEGALFNPLRASRPMPQTSPEKDVLDTIMPKAQRVQRCPFCRVREMTAADSFVPGRVEGAHCITASNVAKYDGRHGLIVFSEHDPMAFSAETIEDYFDVANRWFHAAADAAQECIYPFIMWNCRWRAGGSQEHGHMQLTLAQGEHYPRVESLRRIAMTYRQDYGNSYFADLFEIHKVLGLGWNVRGAQVIASICPFRDNETWIMSRALDAEMATVLGTVLATLRDQANVQSFNAGILLPPVVPRANWKDFPVIVRIIDRLSVAQLPSDISGMGIFAGADAIASDPYAIAPLFKNAFSTVLQEDVDA